MSDTNNPILPNGRLDVSALPNNQPASSPLYPPFPWKTFGGKAIVINYETDMDPVLDLLPPELTPMTDPPIVTCFLNGGYDFAVRGCAVGPVHPVLCGFVFNPGLLRTCQVVYANHVPIDAVPKGEVGYLPSGQSAVGNSRVANRDVSSAGDGGGATLPKAKKCPRNAV